MLFTKASMRPKFDPIRHERRRGILRVAAFSLVVSTLGLGIAAHHAKASTEDKTIELGHELSKVSRYLGDGIQFRVNGQDIYFAHSITSETPEGVIERAERVCESDNPFTELDKDLKAIQEKSPKLQGKILPRLSSFRSVNPREGAITCFGRGKNSGMSAFKALTNYWTTGELGEIGKLRYFYARKGPDGSTEVFSIFTESQFNVSKFFGNREKDEDTPGHDPTMFSRPPESVRMFQADVIGKPYSVAIYDSKKPVDELLKFYDHDLGERGYIAFHDESNGVRMTTYAKENLQVVMTLEKEPDGLTSVTFAEMGSSARVSVR